MTVRFEHAPAIWADFPQLVPGVLAVGGITADADVDAAVARHWAAAAERLGNGTESELPEIQAWRRVFARMGLKPTQYRCASEALLRRFRKEGSLPRIHPLIDLCNAASLVSAIPIAVFDTAAVEGDLEVRYATGDETFETLSGELERPEPREVIFADRGARAHARRWTNRQSGTSAIRPETASALVVAEAVHEKARADVERLVATLADELAAAWPGEVATGLLTAAEPRFEHA
jgi:DNA/RNA-binding domain of Phe-tRNA-synthetase-like protein